MKKPLVLIAAVILILVAGYLVKSMSGGSTSTPTQTQTSQESTVTPASSTAVSNDVLMTSSEGYLTDSKGMTLYIYDKDTIGVSNCYGQCAVAWPIYSAANAPAALPADVTVIKRTDGTSIYAYKGMPLYYYVTDTKVGDVTGDGVGGVWHLVRP